MTFTRFLFIIFIGCLAIERAAFATIVSDNQKLIDAGFTQQWIDEPVFEGRAVIYQANSKAQHSVILIHGINGQAANWYHQLLELKKHYHVISFDLPGFGQSDKGNRLYSPPNYARFVDYVAERFTKAPFDLMGHSMGGTIALRYAANYPGKVRRLILVDAAGILHEHAFAKSMAEKQFGYSQDWTRYVSPSLRELANRFMSGMEGLPLDVRKALEIPQLRQWILRGNPTSIAGLALATEDFSSDLQGITLPTLVVWGKNDKVAPLRSGQLLQATLPNAYLKVLNDAQHNAMADQALAFNRLMLDHLRATDSTLTARKASAPRFQSSQRIGRCSKGEEKEFRGAYRRIELDECRLATIKNAQVEFLTASNSNFEMQDSIIISEQIGLVAIQSRARITNSRIRAKVAIQSELSYFDLAGVTLEGSQYSVNNLAASSFVFSICRTNQQTLHSFKRLHANDKIN